jgi:hypothetical protein
MRLFLPAVTAILLVADQSAWAQSNRAGCLTNPDKVPNAGLATRELRLRAGHFCRLYMFSYHGFPITVSAVHITVPPTHGTVRTLEGKGGGSVAYTVAYTPARGFIGHDRFEVIYQWTILWLTPDEIQQHRPNQAAYEVHGSAEYKAEVTVTP